MTTSTCHRPSLALTVLDQPVTLANPHGITGPRDIASVKMLRISVTDICNLRCVYCMPAEGVEWLPKSTILTYEEIATVVRASVQLGITHFKLTGGEPTARKDLPLLVAMLRRIAGVEDLSLTTNGILLGPLLRKLKEAGLDRMTISLDSLRPDRFCAITRGGDFHRVWQAIEEALAMGFARIKINCVVMKGVNEDEVADFAALTLRWPVTVRFIEFMPLGRSGLTDHPEEAMIPEAVIRRQIMERHGPLSPLQRDTEIGVGPAKVWQIPGAIGRIGFISAMSHPFCESCNRLRMTPDGLMRSCLFDGGEVDLKEILRHSALDPTGNLAGIEPRIMEAMAQCVKMKPDTHSFHGNKAMNRIGG
jgi:GTP 3',8-cyclase